MAIDRVRIVCISDTHNDDCTGSLPDGDILIHAGDMTDDGTAEELQAAYDWIAALPHRVKIIVAGNHDLGLDKGHEKFLPQSLELFTSETAKAVGIHYIDRTIQNVPLDANDSRSERSQVKVYGNPLQPDFLNTSYAFTYAPDPSDAAVAAWADAPTDPNAAPIWVTHGPPKGRLDWIPIPPLRGCAEQARRVAHARPVLAVFGHYHVSHGVELVSWQRPEANESGSIESVKGEGAGQDEAAGTVGSVEVLVRDGNPCHLDFITPEKRFRRGEKTVFVNAAWMTLEKRKTEERYQPVVVDLPASLLSS